MLFFNKLCFSNIARACPLIPSINTTLFFLTQPYQTSQQAAKNCQNKENVKLVEKYISISFPTIPRMQDCWVNGHLNLQGQGLDVPGSSQIHPLQ